MLETLREQQEARTPLLVAGDPRRGKSSLLAYLSTELVEGGWRPVTLSTRELLGQPMAAIWQAILVPLGLDTIPTGAPGALDAQRQALLIDDLSALWRASELPAIAEGLSRLATAGLWIVATSSRVTTAAERAKLRLAFFEPLVLPPLVPAAADQLLARGAPPLSAEDRAYARKVCGGEPFLLQRLAGALWTMPTTGADRRRRASLQVLSTADDVLANRWRGRGAELWTLLALALAEIDEPVTPMGVPETGVPARDALLDVLRRLSSFELRLLARGALAQSIEDGVSRKVAMTTMFRLLSPPAALARGMSALLVWRPDLAFYIQRAARTAKVRATASTNLNGLLQRGLIRRDGDRLTVRAQIRLWWLVDQVGALARGDVQPVPWMQLQGLSAPSPQALAHLQWRIERLSGLLSVGARSLIERSVR